MNTANLNSLTIGGKSVNQIQIGDKVFSFKPYTPVEYLASTGVQYINTGYVPTHNTSGSVEFEWSSIAENQWLTVMGSRTSSGSDDQFSITTDTGNSYVGFAGQELTINPSINQTNTRYVVTISKVNTTVNGVVAGTYTSSVVMNSVLPIYLFGRNNTGSGFGNGFTGRIYGVKLYENGTLVRDFIPVRWKETGVLGMWDKVTEQFYTNQGSGSFTTAS